MAEMRPLESNIWCPAQPRCPYATRECPFNPGATIIFLLEFLGSFTLPCSLQCLMLLFSSDRQHRKCGQSIFAHLWLGRTRICIAPIPDDELPATWAGQLLLTLQKRKEERWRKRRGSA
jgi:hypothetical protein